MLLETLSVLAINSSDISLNQYKTALEKEPIKQELIYDKNSDFTLSKEDKEYLNNELSKVISILEKFKEINRDIFINNFDRWEIEEADRLLSFVKYITNAYSDLYNGYIKESKYYKKYPSLSNKAKIIANIQKDIYEFTKSYLKRAKEANEAYKFMSKFIPQNREVLEALA